MTRSKTYSRKTQRSTTAIDFWINPRTQYTTSGVHATNNEQRNLIRQALLSSNKSEMLWEYVSNRAASYILDIFIYGDTFNADGQRLHPYRQIISTPPTFGGNAVWATLHDAVDNLKTIKIDVGDPGYIETTNRLIINNVVVRVYEETYRGGSGRRPTKPDSFPITKAHYAREAKLRLSYGDLRPGEDPSKNNNCAFRALYDQCPPDMQKWFKRNFNLKTIRKEFDLPPNCKISPEELVRICESRQLYVEVVIVRGKDWKEAEWTTIECDKNLCTDLRRRRVILHTDVEHYYVGTVGNRLGSTGDSECPHCGERVPDKDAIRHELCHKIMGDFKVPFALPEGALLPEEGESEEEHSERYTSTYVQAFKNFYDDPNTDEILGPMGPGGCGKSEVVKKFKELYPDINVVCLAKTGVASQNIEGITFDSFMMKLRTMKEFPDLIIIDEMSFLSAAEFDKLNKTLREKTGVNSVMGGIKTIVMGDFLQLLPFGEDSSCLFSNVFIEHVRAVPMLYGFRYKNDQEFYKLLLQLRSGYVSKTDFLNAGFGMMTKSEWIHNFSPEDRPTMLVFKNGLRRKLEAEVRAFDTSYEDVKIERITLRIDRIDPDKNGDVLSKKEQRLCGSVKGRVIKNVEHPDPDASFCIALSDSEFDGEINADKNSFYPGERVMTLKNKCDDQGILMNGSEVTFVCIKTIGEEEFMVVKTKDGTLCSIPKVTRGCKFGGSFYICEGFPVQSASVTTIFKSQGKTYSSIVVDIPNAHYKSQKHLYYVAISRCVTAKTVSFMLQDHKYDTVNDGLRIVHERFYSQRRNRKPLVEHNEAMVKVMKYSETGGLIKLCPAIDQFQDIRNSSSFPSASNAVYWEPKIPAKAADMELHRKMLTGNDIFFDIETGAQIGYEDHPLHFNKEGDFICHDNTMRHDQTPWLFSFLHIRDARIVWMKDEAASATEPDDKDLLHSLSNLQDPDTGIVHIQLDCDDGDYCQVQFVKYVLYEARRLEAYKTKKLAQLRCGHRAAHLSRYDRLPCTLIGFNSDNFDCKSVINALDSAKIELPENYQRNIIRNSGTAITRLTIVNDNWYNIGELVATHDLFRYMGCIYGLKDTHASLMAKPYGSDPVKLEAFIQKYTTDTTLVRNLCKHTEMGKGEFPHLLTQQKGYKVTLSKEVKRYALKYYPESMQAGLEDPSTRTFSIYHKAREYMNGDIYCLIGAYLGANEAIGQDLGVPILSLNTAQQKTTANNLYTGSHIEGLIKVGRTDKYGEKTTFHTKFSLPNQLVQDMVDKATYGGQTTPRIIEWNEIEGDGTYNQVDESGMYADAQEKCNYPYGPHQFTANEDYCDWVLQSWHKMPTGDCMKDPVTTDFPFMYIADVTIRVPSLCIDPTLPFKDSNGQLNWGVANEGTTNGIRRQCLTSVHLGTLKNMGGELLKVHSFVFWYKYGKIYNKYMVKLNTIKYTTKDAVLKLSAKLDANANYGASLKKDNDVYTATYRDHDEYGEICKKLDPYAGFYRRELPNGKTIVQGHLRADLKETSSRPMYLGSFVLAHSQFKLNKFKMTGFGPTFVPKTLADARDGLIHQPAYGDTDSLYIHDTHIKRLLEHAATPGGVNYLYDTTCIVDPSKPTVEELLDKLGRYCDEVANDNGCGHLVNYEEGIYTTVIQFASGGPKAYTCAYRMPNGKIVYKNSIKGVKKGAKMVGVSASGDRKRALEDAELRFEKKSKAVHDEVYASITNEDRYLATRAERTMKNFGLTPQNHEKSVDKDGIMYHRDPNTYSTTNVNRDVLKTITTRRRKLTPEEVMYLDLRPYDANRILVPFGWNWDGALFMLN